MTSTESVQLAEPATVPPVNVMTAEPAVAVKVPPQVFDALEGVATTIEAGRLSVKARLSAADGFTELLIVKVKVLTPSTAISVGAKTLLKAGALLTVRVAIAGPLLPRDEVKSPEVLRWDPMVELVTSTCTVQLVPAVTDPPL